MSLPRTTPTANVVTTLMPLLQGELAAVAPVVMLGIAAALE